MTWLWFGSMVTLTIWAFIIAGKLHELGEATRGVMRELHYIRRAMNDHWFGAGSKMWGDEL